MRPLLLAVTFFAAATALRAQTLTIYDDALQNTFQNYSYGGGSNFDDGAVVRSGLKAISFTGSNFNAVALFYPGANLTTATYPVLRFWIHGGAAGGQQLRIHIASDDVYAPAAGVELDAYIAGGIAAGEWHEVTVNLTEAPFNTVTFDRIDIQSDVGGAQPTLYIDDVTLGQAAAAVIPPMLIERNVTVQQMTSDRFTWRDSANQPRVAALAHNDGQTGPGGGRGGALREYRYQLPNGTTRIAGLTGYGAGDAGFGYVVSHAAGGGCANGDDSPLGGFLPGNGFERVFEGRHHAIFRFRQNYPRNCPADGSAPRNVPVTIDWIFVTGRDHPVWAITYDLENASPAMVAGTLNDDSRAPYGELAIDGEGFTALNGVAWGDRYRFTSTNAAGTAVTLNSSWNWETPNSVPHIKEWLDGPLTIDNKRDATMGIVQTQTIAEQDAGGGRSGGAGSITNFWGLRSDLVGNACTNAGRTHPFPCANDWPYQANANSLDFEFPNGSNNARMTWKTQYGFLGQATYQTHNGLTATAPGWPRKSYSTFIILGTHTSGPVEAQVTQVETLRTLTLTSAIGSVATTGPAGVARADTVPYVPAGYNHVYAALAFLAAGNQLDANIAVEAGRTLKNPLIIVSNYTAGDPQQVRLGDATLTPDVDYFVSTRPGANELWLTLNRNLTGGTNRLEIIAAGGLLAPSGFAATAVSSSQVNLTWNAVAGAASYEIHRGTTIHNVALFHTTDQTSYSDHGRTADTSYVYKVRALNGGTSSAFAVDVATTVVFADEPLNAGTIAKAIHVTELRTAAAAMRAAAALADYLMTDPGLAIGTPIRAAHVNELRTAIAEARAAIGVAAIAYPDSPVLSGTTTIKRDHVTTLRDAVR